MCASYCRAVSHGIGDTINFGMVGVLILGNPVISVIHESRDRLMGAFHRIGVVSGSPKCYKSSIFYKWRLSINDVEDIVIRVKIIRI